MSRVLLSDKSIKRLIVFSDDWGRHPSSCQHLVSHLLHRFDDVSWVNTIGTRMPSLSREDLAKVLAKVQSWFELGAPSDQDVSTKDSPTVLNPRMYPGFRSKWQRGLNARLISHSVNQSLGERQPGEQRIAITTIPLTADLIRTAGNSHATLDVDDWIYYCVDDFSVWPGLDVDVMQRLETLQLQRVQGVVAASSSLANRLQTIEPTLQPVVLTHGIDPSHWACTGEQNVCDELSNLPRPLFLFWGLLDRRLDTRFCQRLCNFFSERRAGSLVLLGPQQNPDPAIQDFPGVHFIGRKPYAELPAFAHQADVLVMPYADLPVTKQMQPLKFKEYLATGKPVVARKLPSNEMLANTCDLVDDADQFVERCWQLAETGTPKEQLESRNELLSTESWSNKAEFLHDIIRQVCSDQRASR